MGKLMVVVTRFFLFRAVLWVVSAVADEQATPGWYHNSESSIIHEDSSGLRVVWENSYIYQHPGPVNLYWYAQVKFLNVGSQPIKSFCSSGDPSVYKEHIRGTQGIPPNGDGYVPAQETFCSRNPNFTGSIEPGGVLYDWAIFHNVPGKGGEVSLEWGIQGRSAWVDPWYRPYPHNVPPPAECPPELVTLGTCVENIVMQENQVKRIVDLVGDVVTGSKVVCDILGCEAVKFPKGLVDFLQKIFTVFNLGETAVQEVIFGDKLKIVNQAIREHGRDSPQARQALEELRQATRNLWRTLLSVVPGLDFIFPLPIE